MEVNEPSYLTDTQAINLIYDLMNGAEWDSDTTDAIAHALFLTGRILSEPEGDDE